MEGNSMEGPRFNFNPSIDAGPEEIKKQKEFINKEGMEGNAALLIGTEEDLPVLQERLETEGKAKDLASLIRLHKKVFLDSKKIPADIIEQLTPGMIFWFPGQNGHVFIDKDKNIAFFELDWDKITDIEEKRAMHNNLTSEFEKLGFTFIDRDDSSGDMNYIRNNLYKLIKTEERETKERAEVEKKTSFSF